MEKDLWEVKVLTSPIVVEADNKEEAIEKAKEIDSDSPDRNYKARRIKN